jgi:hypothetical protein
MCWASFAYSFRIHAVIAAAPLWRQKQIAAMETDVAQAYQGSIPGAGAGEYIQVAPPAIPKELSTRHVEVTCGQR